LSLLCQHHKSGKNAGMFRISEPQIIKKLLYCDSTETLNTSDGIARPEACKTTPV
jgi:hypothetical protein